MQSRYKGMSVAGRGFGTAGLVTTLVGAIPLVGGCPSIGTDSYEEAVVAPQACGVGAALVGTGMALMLGPGLTLNLAANQQIPRMEGIIARDRASAAAPLPNLELHAGLGRVSFTLRW